MNLSPEAIASILSALTLAERAIDLDAKLSDSERESAEIDAVRAVKAAQKVIKG